MASANTVLKQLLGVKSIVVEGYDFFDDQDAVKHLRIHARPAKWHENRCPFCHRRCPGYDRPAGKSRIWRGSDWNGILVEIEASTCRIQCPEHGVVTADVPWAYPESGFTKEFDRNVAWLATYLPRSTVSEYMRIDWATVGRCISRSLHDIEPERSRRLEGLVNIGIDETSYRKGHKYITVVVNHDTNTVVWASNGYGKKVLEQFYRLLTPEQLASIKVTTGDGAKWITECVEKYTPGCERCVDPFHAVEWAMGALDEVRKEIWREAYAQAVRISKEHPRRRGRPKTDDAESAMINASKTKANRIKHSAYALGKAPEHLTENQEIQVAMIAEESPRLYRAYRIKEQLRLLLKIRDLEEAEAALKRWLWWASHCRIPAMVDLCKKVRRHRTHILNAVRLGFSNARIEATNNKIKLVIRKAYGFRNIQNMLDMVYLVCSNLRITLPNRKPHAA